MRVQLESAENRQAQDCAPPFRPEPLQPRGGPPPVIRDIDEDYVEEIVEVEMDAEEFVDPASQAAFNFDGSTETDHDEL